MVGENVVTLDVSVDNVIAVKVVESTERLPKNPFKRIFGIELFSSAHSLNDWRDGAVHQFNEDPENATIVIVGIDNVETESVCLHAHAHESHFIVHKLLVLLVAWCAEF